MFMRIIPVHVYVTCTEDTRSHSGSSSSGSERDESDAEDAEDINEDKKAEQPGEDRRAETVAQPVENDEPNPGEAAATEDSASVARDSHVDSAGDSTEIEISDTSVPSGSDTRQSDGKDAEKMIEESKDEEEQERGEYKTTRIAVEWETSINPSCMEIFPLLTQPGLQWRPP